MTIPVTGLAVHSTNRTKEISTALSARARDGVDGKVVAAQVVEQLPEEYIQRLQFIARGMDALRVKIEALEGQGTLTPSDANDLVRSFGSRLDVTIEEKLADAIGDIRSRLSVVEQRESPQVSNQLTKLAEAVHAVSDLVASVEETVEQKSSQLERKYAEIASHINGVEDRVGKLALFGDLLATEVRKIGMA
jgi:hypothetical protein